MTEDNFGFPSGLYRYLPRRHPLHVGRLVNEGRLQMLAVEGTPGADLAATQPDGARHRVRWVDIDDPNPSFPFTPGQPAPTTNNEALNYVAEQGRAQGAARLSRVEGATYDRGTIYFCSTQGGGPAEPGPSDTVQGWGNGFRQIWAYDISSERLRLVVQSPGPRRSTSPTTSPRASGARLCCEDSTGDNSCGACPPTESCGTSR